jgi:hypothetical protein
MKLVITRDFNGNWIVMQVLLLDVSPTVLAHMRASGQIDCGKRQRLQPVLGDDDFPLQFGPEGREDAQQAAQEVCRREREAGRAAEIGEVDRTIPCL